MQLKVLKKIEFIAYLRYWKMTVLGAFDEQSAILMR
jgi:hypothetical protein